MAPATVCVGISLGMVESMLLHLYDTASLLASVGTCYVCRFSSISATECVMHL